MTKTTNRKNDDRGMRAVAFFVLILAMTGMLVFVWMGLPKKQAPAPAPVDQTQAQKAACESGGGQWVACGQPACAPGQQCTKACVAKCIKPQLPAPEPAATSTQPLRERPAGMLCDDTNSICVDPSFAAQTLTSPFVATGTAVAFENQFSWRLEDASGTELEQGSAYASSSDAGQFGPFSIRSFILDVPKTSTGTLVLFEASAKDGTPIHVVKVPVQLPQKSQSVSISCGNEHASFEVVKTKAPIEATLRTLFSKYLSGNASIDSVTLNSGALTVTAIGQVNDSALQCIKDTVKQFSSVRSVVIQP